ncbi:hypothetical protein AMES_7801 [Amycolatopsis mediterranei S699]|uniref:Uncharacterized protein n=2 Tax=Amycolatopsis mediterranei TaxID=33910 RepID=A0A0H3DIW6_AMYMU|nr:hypothetical protein [Amycolatopsis mediterranei]ADJ49624.1 conserved hypothetical protein [Amycolatopsis mediterranei U32]AEK46608.1 hypothetical protein RAM_40705 [Amycolatopsis mediterranei S699]AFO81334.1 hypothetical protein AMES_7801 [Amycolatopsis mediterranei S699]AGT88462.1 hypothetical protein B737_7801 [Amycolatopsis mediterranei RB]KDO08127.1 hypothetical protein DV26_27975 [Amycolatopsis mediterranei]
MTVPITASNSTTGAGVFDSWKQVGDSIGKVQTEHGGDLAAVSVELGINLISATLDTVAFVMDPLSKLIAAGLGWLIEHVSFLKWPLDQVAGNPSEVTKVANELHKIGEALRNTGTQLDDTLKSTITQWQGKGYDSFKKSIDDRKGWIDANAKASDVAGYMVETTGALIAAVRALLRDIITTILGDIISTMLIALAMAAFTFGASIAVGVSKIVVQVSIQVAAMAAKLAKVVAYAGRTLARLTKLSKLVKPKPGASGAGHEMTNLPPGGNTVPNFSRPLPPKPVPPGTAVTHDGPGGGGATPSTRPPGDGTTPNFSRPLPKPADPPPPPPPPPAPKPPSPSSHLSEHDFPMIKKHEDWLKTKFGDSYKKMKFVDDWLKAKHPDYYPMLKALSDAKSSKNFVGWAGKDIVQVDRGLTDIQMQAEAAWAEEDKKQQQQQQPQ